MNNIQRIRVIFLTGMMIISFMALIESMSVMASEEEETDDFNIMPNYRWENQTVTDEQVTEQLIGDQYEVYSQNNATTGYQELEKSRALNGRDFYFNTRLQVDNGGNETEYSRDILGDTWDFVDDVDNWITFSGANMNVDGGLLIGTRNTVDSIYGTEFTFAEPISTLVWESFNFRLKSIGNNEFTDLRLRIYNGSNDIVETVVIVTTIELNEWIDYNVDLAATSSWLNIGKSARLVISVNGIAGLTGFAIDYIELIGVTDFATHVEGEVEDTWDWEDSSEYWYDELNNVSDFNDGTTEGWVSAPPTNPTVVQDSGFLKVTDVGETSLVIDNNRTELGGFDTDYDWFTMEFNSTNNVTDISLKDEGGIGTFVTDSTGWIAGEMHLVSLDLGWSGAEDWLRIDIDLDGPANQEIFINFTYIYDVSLGDLEGFNLGGNSYAYVNPEGYIVQQDAGAGAMGLYIISIALPDVFNQFEVRIKSGTSNSLTLRTWFPAEVLDTWSITSEWQVFNFDLSTVDNWIVENGGFYLRSENLERIEIDYLIITGHWSNESDSGFSFDLLNENDEVGMEFNIYHLDWNGTGYMLEINMFDASGIALEHQTSFNYSRRDDGYLMLDVEWNLDKRKVRIIFEHDNGTEILKARSLNDLYGVTGIPELILLKQGFPQLMINNTVGAFARSLVIIDYIDANYRTIAWNEPDADYTVDLGVFYGVFYQNDSNLFDSIHPYGLVSEGDDMDSVDHVYTLVVDKLDGIVFDARMITEDLEGSELGLQLFTVIDMVQVDGTIIRVGYIYSFARGLAAGVVMWDSIANTSRFNFAASGADQLLASYSIFREDKENIIFQVNANLDGTERTGTTVVKNSGLNNTREFIITQVMSVDNDFGGFADDKLYLNIGGFEILRKDIVSELVAAIVQPLADALAFIFSPIFAFFELMLMGLIAVGKFIVDGLEPIMSALGDVISGAISELGGTIGGIIGELETGIGGIITGLETGIGTIMDGVEGVLGTAIGAVATAVGFVTDAVEALAADIWISMLTAVSDITEFVETIITDLVGTMETLLAAWIGFLNEFWTAIIVDFLQPLMELIITELGLVPLWEFLVTFIEGFVLIVGVLFGLIAVMWGGIFALLTFWLVAGRLQAMMLCAIVVVGIWLLIPLFKLFSAFANQEVSFSLLEEVFSEFFGKVATLLNVGWRVIDATISFVFSALTTIGGFIPFT